MKYSDLIKHVQTALNDDGEKLAVDGEFGPKSAAALEKFDLTLIDFSRKPLPLPPVGPDPSLKKGTVEWYENAYGTMTFDKGLEYLIETVARRVLAGKERYKAISDLTGVPWVMIGCIHNMECSCNFKGVLHNGQLIVGTGKKTTIVPIGLGPFATWEESALDALAREGLTGITNWSLGLELKMQEAFNGLGYLKYHQSENSPYLWACTSLNDGYGKYVSDGKYDSSAPTNNQVGVAAIYKQIELWGEF